MSRIVLSLVVAFGAVGLVHCGSDAEDADPVVTTTDSGVAETAAAIDSAPAPDTFVAEDTLVAADTLDATTEDTTVADVPVDSGTARVVINEIESSGGMPGDWIELFNAGTVAADISGYKVQDNDPTHVFALPAGTVIAPGGYFVIEESDLTFGLGSADSARLYAADGTTLVDEYAWTAHAAETYGRCPNGTGAFGPTVPATKGAANTCGMTADAGSDSGSDAGLALRIWPGSEMTSPADTSGALGGNVSGVLYDSSSTTPLIWAVRNGPSTLYRLAPSGSSWTSESGIGWGAGKTLRYADGTGVPDAEDLTKADPASSLLYVATERDNDVSGVSRPSVLLFDTSVTGTTLLAKREWKLVDDLPKVGPNLGLEAITYLPDSYLTARGFRDERLGKAYAPADYPEHGGGLFLVGLEANGALYVYALNHTTSAAQRVATIASGFSTIASVALDRDVGGLLAYCDDACGNRLHVLAIDGAGRFTIRAAYGRPTGLPNSPHEGITFAPESKCTGGQKPFFWADDAATGGNVLHRGTIACGALY